jgi:hypothetical protein
MFGFYIYLGRSYGHDRMVIVLTSTYVIGAYLFPSDGKVYLILLYVMRQTNGFLQALRFPPPTKLTGSM